MDIDISYYPLLCSFQIKLTVTLKALGDRLRNDHGNVPAEGAHFHGAIRINLLSDRSSRPLSMLPRQAVLAFEFQFSSNFLRLVSEGYPSHCEIANPFANDHLASNPRLSRARRFMREVCENQLPPYFTCRTFVSVRLANYRDSG